MLNNECILDDIESLLKKVNDAGREVAKQMKQRDCLKADLIRMYAFLVRPVVLQ
jgi:hypothetical protein